MYGFISDKNRFISNSLGVHDVFLESTQRAKTLPKEKYAKTHEKSAFIHDVSSVESHRAIPIYAPLPPSTDEMWILLNCAILCPIDLKCGNCQAIK